MKIQELHTEPILALVWVNLLAFVTPTSGYLPDLTTPQGRYELMATMPRWGTEAETLGWIRALTERGLIEEVEPGLLQMKDWHDHQPRSGDLERRRALDAERQRRCRKNKKAIAPVQQVEPPAEQPEIVTEQPKPAVAIEERKPKKVTAISAEDEDMAECRAHFLVHYPQHKVNHASFFLAWDCVWGKDNPTASMSPADLLRSGIPDKAYYFDAVVPGLERYINSEEWAEDEGRWIQDAAIWINGDNKPGSQRNGRMWLNRPRPSKSHVAQQLREQAPASFEVPDDVLDKLRGKRRNVHAFQKAS